MLAEMITDRNRDEQLLTALTALTDLVYRNGASGPNQFMVYPQLLRFALV